VNKDLYPQILSRKSIRGYDQRRFDPEDKARIEVIIKNTQPLIAGNQFQVIFREREKGQDLISVLGAYGRFISPPYYLLPYLIGDKLAYVDLGYRVQQITIQLWSKGIGSCNIGCLSRQAKVRKDFQLPENAMIAAFLVIGYPGENSGIDKISNGAKAILGIRNRLPIQEICFQDTFEKHFEPDGLWRKIIEAGCMAPSAVNAQPWRFLLLNNELHLFSVQDGRKYLLPENRHYALHDCGGCMANMDMTMAAMGYQRDWNFLDGQIDEKLKCPPNLYPLAKLIIKE